MKAQYQFISLSFNISVVFFFFFVKTKLLNELSDFQFILTNILPFVSMLTITFVTQNTIYRRT